MNTRMVNTRMVNTRKEVKAFIKENNLEKVCCNDQIDSIMNYKANHYHQLFMKTLLIDQLIGLNADVTCEINKVLVSTTSKNIETSFMVSMSLIYNEITWYESSKLMFNSRLKIYKASIINGDIFTILCTKDERKFISNKLIEGIFSHGEFANNIIEDFAPLGKIIDQAILLCKDR
jgi:hypothetical protein